MNPEEKVNTKAESFLSSLRKGSGSSAPASGQAAEAAAVAVQARLGGLNKRLEELEARLQAQAAEPPAPPSPPVEGLAFFHERVGQMEARLQEARAEAQQAYRLLRERDLVQRRAQEELADLFRNLREQSRVASSEVSLRQELRAAHEQIDRLRQEVSGIGPEVAAPALSEPPVPPFPPETRTTAPPAYLELVLARVADLERTLEEDRRRHEEESSRQRVWEKVIISAASEREGLEGLSPASRTRAVQVALQSAAANYRRREALEEEMSWLSERLAQESPGSLAAPELKARLESAQEEMRQVQMVLDRQAALVAAWLRA